MSRKRFISVCEPLLLGNEKRYITDAIDTGWVSSAGKYIPLFEDAFAEFCGVKHATAVSNGTNAIHLALKALGVGPGDEVIVPDFTMICSALPVCYLGAMPVFVDAEPITWNIDPTKIAEKLSPKTKAIMVVHIYGHPCDMTPIREIAKQYDLKIIEDAAEAHGAEYRGKKCGALGDIAAFSFFANKVVTAGEGGMVITDSDELIERSRYYKDLCFPSTGERTYFHEDIGFQYRLSNLQAAIGCAQVEKINDYIEMRRRNNSLYRKYLRDIDGIVFQPERAGCKNIYWMNAAILDSDSLGVDRDSLMGKLAEHGIQTRKFFVPMHMQPALQKYGCDTNGTYPVSDWLSTNGLYFPSGSGLIEDDIQLVCDCVKETII